MTNKFSTTKHDMFFLIFHSAQAWGSHTTNRQADKQVDYRKKVGQTALSIPEVNDYTTDKGNPRLPDRHLGWTVSITNAPFSTCHADHPTHLRLSLLWTQILILNNLKYFFFFVCWFLYSIGQRYIPVMNCSIMFDFRFLGSSSASYTNINYFSTGSPYHSYFARGYKMFSMDLKSCGYWSSQRFRHCTELKKGQTVFWWNKVSRLKVISQFALPVWKKDIQKLSCLHDIPINSSNLITLLVFRCYWMFLMKGDPMLIRSEHHFPWFWLYELMSSSVRTDQNWTQVSGPYTHLQCPHFRVQFVAICLFLRKQQPIILQCSVMWPYNAFITCFALCREPPRLNSIEEVMSGKLCFTYSESVKLMWDAPVRPKEAVENISFANSWCTVQPKVEGLRVFPRRTSSEQNLFWFFDRNYAEPGQRKAGHLWLSNLCSSWLPWFLALFATCFSCIHALYMPI